MKSTISAYQGSENHSYIEIINNGTFDAYFTVNYTHNNSNYSFKSKTLKPGMLDKIITCKGGLNVYLEVYIIKSNGESLMLYNKSLTNSTTLKILLSGTELSPVYQDITNLPSPNDSSEFYSYYVSVTNTGSYVAKLKVQYTINGKTFNATEDNISNKHTEIIKLPTIAQNIKVSIEIRVNKTAWIPIYNNTLPSPSILKLSLSGTFTDPIVTNISSELSTGNLPTLSDNAISVVNNGDFISQFYIAYSTVDTTNSITTNNFSKGETKSITIPTEATNIELAVNIMYTDNSWINIYQDFFKASTALKLELTGTLSSPVVTDVTNNPPGVGDPEPVTPPIMKLTKEPNKPIVMLGEEVMFTLILTHTGGSEAENIVLKDMIPTEAFFIPNSLTVNGTITDSTFISSGLNLGSINLGDSHSITYKIKFNSVPNSNIVKQDANINYSYTDSDSSMKQDSLISSTVPLMVVAQNNCCCCSPCNCNCNYPSKDDAYVDYFDHI